MGRHSKKITLDQLETELAKILEEYKNDLDMTLTDACVKAGNKAAAALRGSSYAVIGGRYSRGWGYTTVKKEPFRDTVYIWQKEAPGLPHLLEFGHAMPQGGRTQPKPHVEPVVKVIAEDFYQFVYDAIENME